MKPTTPMLLCITILLSPELARAQACEPTQIQTSLLLLRRMSLDLRSRIPSVSESEEVVSATTVDEQIVDRILASPELAYTVQRIVRDLLWGEIRQGLNEGSHQLVPPSTTEPYISPAFWMPFYRSQIYRGGNGFVTCKDEPAQFDQSGRPLTTPGPQPNTVQEGWVEVTPYWTSTGTVRVCAFDASAIEVSSAGRDCSLSQNAFDAECGCGANLRFCQAYDPTTRSNTTGDINRAMYAQVDRLVQKILRDHRPWTELLTANELELNGPLSHYLRYQTGTAGGSLFATGDQGYFVPAIPFEERDTWVSVSAQPGYRHAGVLSSIFFLLKFQSNRSRANRFYNSFLCQYFQAPPGGLPDPNDACNGEPNLSERCGCQYCHSALEPAAGYWGRWAERGIVPLISASYPTFDPSCTSEPLSNRCRSHYFTTAGHPDEVPYVGKLRAYLFAEPYEDHIEDGPRALANEAIASGQFADCAVRQLWTRLVARAPTYAELPELDALASEFAASNYDIRALIKAIVMRPEYAESAYCAE